MDKDPVQKALGHVDRAAQTRDQKACAHLCRMLPALRRVASLQSLGAFAFQISNKAPDWCPDAVCDKPGSKTLSAEADTFFWVLVCMALVKERLYEACQRTALQALSRPLENRCLFPYTSKLYFYLALSQERLHTFDSRYFLQEYRSACLRHDKYSQATLLNILMRGLLLSGKVEQAQQLDSKTEFPKDALHAEMARHLYYQGRIKALQLSYSDAHSSLVQAMRKTPEKGAKGFKTEVQKLMVVVDLLMGEIPSKKLLLQDSQLKPYLDLVRVVRVGELEKFTVLLNLHNAIFLRDQNLSLVTRLRHIVIKSGLRKINIAYSQISLADVSSKLGLPPNDTEFIVAKAIRDGVIEATIDHEAQTLRSKTLEDAYTTLEPQQNFQRRIKFCLELRNETVKCLQFPQQKQQSEQPPVLSEDVDIHMSDEEDDF